MPVGRSIVLTHVLTNRPVRFSTQSWRWACDMLADVVLITSRRPRLQASVSTSSQRLSCFFWRLASYEWRSMAVLERVRQLQTLVSQRRPF